MKTTPTSTAQELRQLADFIASNARPGTVLRGLHQAYVAEQKPSKVRDCPWGVRARPIQSKHD